MPRENRKRGKKVKKSAQQDPYGIPTPAPEPEPEASHAGPSWIAPNPNAEPEVNPEAPFGYVDADVKAYFRTVDVQIRAWQENQPDADDDGGDIDPNEKRRMFFVAALTEMAAKEKQLSTDPDCSIILERMTWSMDDFVRRVFVDSLTGSYEVLAKHRFASHVCQTLFDVAADTVSRESRGIFPSVPDAPAKGELRTLTQLVTDICSELLPSVTQLIMDPYASHVLHALLLLLCPSARPTDHTASTRSKKSAAWKARQGPVAKSVFTDAAQDKVPPKKVAPPEFEACAARIVDVVRDELSANEVRALAANASASPVLQVLLEIEAAQGTADVPDSLTDRVLVGIITSYHADPPTTHSQSDYLSTLLRDPTASHLLETLVTHSPPPALAILWDTYFAGQLARLSLHPVANFVLARALEHVDADALSEACAEMDKDGAWGRMIRVARTGVLRAVIDRAAALHAHEAAACEAVFSAFDLATTEDRALLVPAVMALKPLEEYNSAKSAQEKEKVEPEAQAEARHQHPDRRHATGAADPLEPKTQGAVLLQSLLRLAEPHNQVVTNSLSTLPTPTLLQLAHNSTSSRVLDAVLTSPSVPLKAKRALVTGFIASYHTLVDDRIGSRVADRCWAFADPYLKEKIARSLIPFESFLAGSYYGKFFARGLNLYLLQKRPDEWKALQAQRKAASAQATTASTALPHAAVTSTPHTPASSQKRKRPENEIDALFDATLGRRQKKSAIVAAEDAEDNGSKLPTRTQNLKPEKVPSVPTEKTRQGQGDDLSDVLGAIRTAPKGEKREKRRKR
ncbi:hypothetical protein PLICRDRAFT_34962 [Plicaturopsis crispa FD-325 SS-3]|nr:hypothetical protein PLICRDRAFT_34962 [Plicaturopsis crispa FD-325 SS-3]